MNADNRALIAANIRKARTLRELAPEDYQVPYRSFAALMEERAKSTPEKTFLTYYNDDSGEKSAFTYAQFNRRVNQVANLLRDEYAVKRGETVATVSFNHPDAIFAFFACWKLGAVATPQNVSEDDSRIAFILRNAQCRVALVRPEYVERVRGIQKLAACLRQMVVMDEAYQQRLGQHPAQFVAPAENMLEDEALLVYTTGTTGAPKGVRFPVQFAGGCQGHRRLAGHRRRSG